MEIAKYILSIFKHYTAIVLSWGAHNFTAVEANDEGEGGLLFNVEGFKFKGQVKVMLNFMDTFDIYLSQAGKIVDKIEDVYIDQLVSVIDHRIEYVPNYEQRVKEEYSLVRTGAHTHVQ